MKKESSVILGKVKRPNKDCSLQPVILADATIQERKEKILSRMKNENLDCIVVYADIEHGTNFEYLVGFVPRFEEALLVLHQNGKAYLVLGNENLNKVRYSRIEAEAVHAPHFSLPNQPMENTENLTSILSKTGIQECKKVGLIGWKLFTSNVEDNTYLFDIPYYIVEAIKELTHGNEICNACSVFIGAEGARVTNNADEIAHYEFGASLASDCVLDALDAVAIGVSELELGNCLNRYGQRNPVITIAATGERFEKAYLYPKNKLVELGDKMALTVGYKGGLSSRSAYVVNDTEDLPNGVKDYLDVVVKPYYRAICVWLENVKCGMSGSEMYELIENVLPKAQYHWHLCPGHLVADEEWLSSPIYENSDEVLKSGMLLQTDIIPSIPGYGGVSVESTICLADKKLRDEISDKAPELWKRIQSRRKYICEELNIDLSDDVLPMCSTVAYLRPYLLNHSMAMKRLHD